MSGHDEMPLFPTRELDLFFYSQTPAKKGEILGRASIIIESGSPGELAERDADSLGLIGDARQEFLLAWQQAFDDEKANIEGN